MSTLVDTDTGRGTSLEVDLDQVVPVPARPRRPFRAALIGVAVLGLLAGAMLRSVTAPAPAPAPPRLAASVGLRTVLIQPVPAVQLEIRVTNLGDERHVADTASISGGGVTTTEAVLGLDLPPGGESVSTATVPLRCGPGQRAGEPVVVRIHLRTAGSGPPGPPIEVVAVPTGRVAGMGGLCAAAQAVLPDGWREPVRVTHWSQGTGHRLDLTVVGLPFGVSTILAVQADGWLLQWTDAPAAIHDGSAELRLEPPAPGCGDGGVRPVLPTGFQLILPSPGGTRVLYAPVGTAAAEWLSDAYLRACPTSPVGPSAVRAGFED